MPEQAGRFEWVARMARIAMIGTLAVLAGAMVFTVATASFILAESSDTSQSAPYVLMFVGEFVLAIWALVALGVIRIMTSVEFGASSAAARLSRLESVLEDQAETLRELIGLAALSDRAKSLIYRQREIEAFREAVHEDIVRQDYETANALIASVEKTFGFTDEALRLREEVAESRKATTVEKIDAGVNRINSIIDRHNWAQALRESRRLVEVYPDNPTIQSLTSRIAAAQTEHKRQLLKDYGDAIQRKDVNKGVELLAKLDRYLTPQEAAALQESARGVLRAKLHNLGVQFSLRVTEERWGDAIEVGTRIIRDYPNSQMAQEVRDKMEQLRALAEAGLNGR